MWGMAAIVCITTILAITTVIVMYKYSGKFHAKIKTLRDNFARLTQQIYQAGEIGARIFSGRPPPNINDHPRVALRSVFFKARPWRAARARPALNMTPTPPSPYVSLHDINLPEERVNQERIESSYVGFRPVEDTDHYTVPRAYPRLTPLMREMSADNRLQADNRLKAESEELQTLIEEGKEIMSKMKKDREKDSEKEKDESVEEK